MENTGRCAQYPGRGKLLRVLSLKGPEGQKFGNEKKWGGERERSSYRAKKKGELASTALEKGFCRAKGVQPDMCPP